MIVVPSLTVGSLGVAVLLLFSLWGSQAANAQSAPAKRAAAGLGQALGDLSNKYIDAEIELERLRAQIELERAKAQREAALKPAPSQATRAPAPADVELDLQLKSLDQTFPGWGRITVSRAFQSWLAGQPPYIRNACESTREADVMTLCLRSFLDSTWPVSGAAATGRQ